LDIEPRWLSTSGLPATAGRIAQAWSGSGCVWAALAMMRLALRRRRNGWTCFWYRCDAADEAKIHSRHFMLWGETGIKYPAAEKTDIFSGDGLTIQSFSFDHSASQHLGRRPSSYYDCAGHVGRGF
jgi:hypothetical protein